MIRNGTPEMEEGTGQRTGVTGFQKPTNAGKIFVNKVTPIDSTPGPSVGIASTERSNGEVVA